MALSVDTGLSCLPRLPSFDLPKEKSSWGAVSHKDNLLDTGTSMARSPKLVSSADLPKAAESTKKWEPEASLLLSSERWLEIHGLKRAKLDMASLLRQMGFRHSNEFDTTLKMPVCSRYGTDLFQKYFRSDGKTYNVIMGTDMMKQIEVRLMQAVKLYQSRLDWLNSESRRLFGVIEEKCVCIVLDFNQNLTQQQFDLFIGALERVIREQISRVSRFNIIRAQEDLSSLSGDLVYVTPENIETAVQWIYNLKRTAAVDRLSACNAVDKASKLSSVDAVYLFTEGNAAGSGKEILSEKMNESKVPVHIVSHNCTNDEAVVALQKLAQKAGTRFHAYAVTVELDLYERVGTPDEASTAPGLVQRKKVFGGVPSGVGVRKDVIQIFEELEEAKNILSHIQAIMKEREKTAGTDRVDAGGVAGQTGRSQYVDETYMSTEEWLKLHGLSALKLNFYDVLSSVAFHHEDGVLDLKVAPPCDDDHVADALTVRKLVNAKYCSKFAHVIWKDGRVMHVNVTKELRRTYSERLKVATSAMQRRIDWLLRGSREIFGTVVEDQIYLLIDTSYSMQLHMQFVKEKIYLLMQEQLRHKQMFNIIAFDTLVRSWHSALVEVSEESLRNAWTWVTELACHGTTNTLGAVQLALKDKQTKAIYLLTDGRPDHPPKSIIAQCKYRYNIPIHTISFNCNDREANEFLFDLAHETGGRFHYYSMSGYELDPAGPVAWQSEDILLLKQEMERARKFLDRVAELHNDCVLLSKDKDDPEPRVVRRQMIANKPNRMMTSSMHNKSSTGRLLHRQTRPTSAPSYRCFARPPADSSVRPQTALDYQNWARTSTAAGLPSRSAEMGDRRTPRLDASSSQVFAGHTRTSLMRTTSPTGARFNEPEFLLPETKELFTKQEQRKKKAERAEENQMKKHKQKTKQLASKLSSKKWLTKHGLAAKKLTILDLLAPTFISHEPQFVPALNKEVLSKVFDDVMPIGYAQRMKRQLYLTNPLAVNFDAYVKKLEEAKQLYARRLDQLVWNGLSIDERQGFDSDVAVSFADNREKLMDAIDRCNSSVRLTDIQLLENEIRLAEQYAEKAKKLRRAAEKHGEGLPEYDDNIDSGTTQQVTEPKKIQPEPDQKKKTQVSSVPVQQKGLRVIARYDDDGFYYPGAIAENVNLRRVKVSFDSPDIDVRDVASRLVIPLTGAIARPTLTLSDHVLCRVLLKNVDQECYVPGKIVGLPARHENKFFRVKLYTGKEEEFMRSHVVKINEIRYDFSVRYIVQKAGIAIPDDPPEEDATHEEDPSDSEKPPRDHDSNHDSKHNVDSRVMELRQKLKRYRKRMHKFHVALERQYKKLEQIKKKQALGTDCSQSCKEVCNEIRKLKDMIADARNPSGRGVRKSDSKKTSEPRDVASSRRQKLKPLSKDEEVLARWSDDGWYYQGVVVFFMDDGSYLVKDSTGYMEQMTRDDVIADADDDGSFDTRKARSYYVIALHPEYEFSYAPGKATGSGKSPDVEVKFYDGTCCSVSRDEVFPISREKYQADVEYIKLKEEELVGQVVIANKDNSGVFLMGEVVSPTGVPREYKIRWSDGSVSTQHSTHLFGSFTMQRKLDVGDRVLAVKNGPCTFLPATIKEITADRTLVIKYCDGSISEEPIEQVGCFWLSPTVYRSLVRDVRAGDIVQAAEKEKDDEGGESDEDIGESPRSARRPRSELESRDSGSERQRGRNRSVDENDGATDDESAGDSQSDVDSGRRNGSLRSGTGTGVKGSDETEDEEDDSNDDDVSV